MKTLRTLLTVILAGSALIAIAQPADDRGIQIAQEADLRDQGFGNSVTNLTMILTNKHGQQSGHQCFIATEHIFREARDLDQEGRAEKPEP